MRPGKIRVFDGLRITTEHMEHLQGSLQSAVQDLREALGLGKVYQGFEAVVESDHLVKVQPGLAFDLAKNRIVSDEPITIEVTFEQQQDTQYVCIKYARVEGGQVEGRPTLIWDSCGVELHPNLPEPKDNLIPIAKLMRSATDRFEVVSLIGDSPDDETHHEESVGDTTTAASPQPSASPGGLLSENPPARPGAWKLCVRQGVVRLASDSGNGKQASTPLVGAIKTAGAGNSANADTLCISRVEATVPLDFPVSSLTCMSLITIVFDLSPASAAATPATAPEATTHTTLRSQAAAHGEATCVGDGLSQFSLSTIRTCPALSANCSAG
ncbi:MAG TPA: hypothetical protein VFU22_07990, partial [Roseiflexaceae bacterium]|nr:hypothetical protein [Roseiflexaceae bacterium]